MITEQIELPEAVSILRHYQWDRSKRRSRVHKETGDKVGIMLQILYDRDLCIGCKHLKINVTRARPRDVLSIECAAGQSPIDLYRKAGMGNTPTCPKFTPKPG